MPQISSNRRVLAFLATVFAISAQGSLALALRVQDKPAQKIPNDLNFANGLFRQGKYNLAVNEYERFLKVAPPGLDRDDALYGLANARLFLGKYQDARRDFEQLLQDNPDYLNASTALFRVGETSYLLGEMDQAVAALEQFTTKYPKHRHLDTAWPRLGDVHYRLGNFDKAPLAYEKAIADFPNGPLADRARLGLAKTLVALAQPDEARTLLRALIAKAPRDLADSAKFELGTLEASIGRFEESVAAFETLEADALEVRSASRSSCGKPSRWRNSSDSTMPPRSFEA